jgi:hypothetical protein
MTIKTQVGKVVAVTDTRQWDTQIPLLMTTMYFALQNNPDTKIPMQPTGSLVKLTPSGSVPVLLANNNYIELRPSEFADAVQIASAPAALVKFAARMNVTSRQDLAAFVTFFRNYSFPEKHTAIYSVSSVMARFRLHYD